MDHSQRFSHFLRMLAVVALLLLRFGSIARAQVGQGEITGLVTDPSGPWFPMPRSL